MSSPTASRWFMPDDDFYCFTQDYAFVGKSSITVENEFAKYERMSFTPLMPKTLRQYVRTGRRWFDDEDGLMVFTDVDAKDPEHENTVRDLEVIKPWLEEQEQKTLDVEKGLVSVIYGECKHDNDDEKKDCLGHPAPRLPPNNIWTLSPKVINHILGLEDPTAKIEALRVLSGQQLYRNPRPVMLLLGVLDDMKPKKELVKGGWALAYNFEKDKVIIKAFQAGHGQHPLGEAWFEPGPGNLMESPATLADDLVSVVTSAFPEEDKPYGKAVAFMIGSWIIWHAYALGLSREVFDKLKEQMNTLESELKEEPFPALDLTDESDPEMYNVVKDEFAYLYQVIHRGEDMLRDIAIEAKEAGFETSADNVALYYEKVLKMLRHMAMNPEKPLDE